MKVKITRTKEITFLKLGWIRRGGQCQIVIGMEVPEAVAAVEEGQVKETETPVRFPTSALHLLLATRRLPDFAGTSIRCAIFQTENVAELDPFPSLNLLILCASVSFENFAVDELEKRS